jgi:hypothetical protein
VINAVLSCDRVPAPGGIEVTVGTRLDRTIAIKHHQQTGLEATDYGRGWFVGQTEVRAEQRVVQEEVPLALK